MKPTELTTNKAVRLRRMRHLASEMLPPLLTLIFVVVIWQAVVYIFQIPAILLPGPARVAQAVFRESKLLLRATGITAVTAVAGLMISLLTGTAVAILFSQSRMVRRSLFPYAIFLQTVPIIAIAPVIVIWMGAGTAAVVVIAAIISFFPIVANTTEGLISVPRSWHELFWLSGASRWQTLWRLQFPAALPNLVAGLKISAGAAVLGTIVGEIFAGAGSRSPGLGYLIFAAKAQFRLDLLFAGVLCCTILGVALFALVAKIGDAWLLRWMDRSTAR